MQQWCLKLALSCCILPSAAHQTLSGAYCWQAAPRCLTHLTLCSFYSPRLAGSFYQLRKDANMFTLDFFLIKEQDSHSASWKLRLTCFFPSLSLPVCAQLEEGKEERPWRRTKKKSSNRVGGRTEWEEDGSSLRRWFEASEPGAGEHSCGSPWALWLFPPVTLGVAYRGPEEPAGASQGCSKSGQAGPGEPGKRQVRRASRAPVPAG